MKKIILLILVLTPICAFASYTVSKQNTVIELGEGDKEGFWVGEYTTQQIEEEIKRLESQITELNNALTDLNGRLVKWNEVKTFANQNIQSVNWQYLEPSNSINW